MYGILGIWVATGEETLFGDRWDSHSDSLEKYVARLNERQDYMVYYIQALPGVGSIEPTFTVVL
jgi:hypothetical protein